MVQLGGAVGRVANDATAYGHRDGQFVMNVHGRWEDRAKDAACIGWARDLFQAAAPFATGNVYVNFLTEEEQDRVPAAYGENYSRLVAIEVAPRAAGELTRRLRLHRPPVFVRVHRGQVLVDPRTLLEGEEPVLVDALVAALAGGAVARRTAAGAGREIPELPTV